MIECNPAAPFFVAFIAFFFGAFVGWFWEALVNRADW